MRDKDIFMHRTSARIPHLKLSEGHDGYIGYKGRRMLSILNKQKLERVLAYLLDENEFLGPHGIRSLNDDD